MIKGILLKERKKKVGEGNILCSRCLVDQPSLLLYPTYVGHIDSSSPLFVLILVPKSRTLFKSAVDVPAYINLDVLQRQQQQTRAFNCVRTLNQIFENIN